MKIWPLVLSAGITTVDSRDCTGKHSYHGRHDHTEACIQNLGLFERLRVNMTDFLKFLELDKNVRKFKCRRKTKMSAHDTQKVSLEFNLGELTLC